MARKKKEKNPKVENYNHEDVKRKTNPPGYCRFIVVRSQEDRVFFTE